MVAEWRVRGSRLGILLVVASALALVIALCQSGSWQVWHLVLISAMVALYVWDLAANYRSLARDFYYRRGRWGVVVGGRAIPVEVVCSHFVLRRLGVVCFRTAEGCRYTVALLPDSLRDEEFRRLAIALR